MGAAKKKGVMRMRVCGTCGLPSIIGRTMRWSSGGNIFARDVENTQIVLIKTDEINNILRGVSDKIGVDLGRIAAKAEVPLGHRLGRAYYAEYLSLVPASRLTRPAFLMKGYYERIFKVFSILGFGRLSLDRYRPRREIQVSMLKPYQPDLLCGLCRGFFEAAEGVPFRYEASEGPEGLVVTYLGEGEEAASGEEERFRYDDLRPLPGNVEHRSCGECGVPVRISQTFYWDQREGLVGNRKHHMREVIMPVEGLNALFRELKEELGEEVEQMAVDIQRLFKRDAYLQPDIRKRRNYLALLRQQTVKGLGNFTLIEKQGDRLRVEVENPFNVPLLVGRVAGYYEALEETEGRVVWEEPGPRRLNIEVSPA